MRIAMERGVPRLDFNVPTHRGESRWAANWIRLLKEAGHEISNRDPDLMLGVSWEGKNAQFKSIPHGHLRFGPLTMQVIDKYLRCWGPNCRVITPYKQALRTDAEFEGRHIFLPFPYANTWLPSAIVPPVSRKELTWAVKSIWHERYRRERPYMAQCGVWTFEALAKFLPKNDFILNIIQCNEQGSSFVLAPDEVRHALNRIANVNMVEGSQPFTDFVDYMSRSRMSFCIGGATGGILEATFSECVPLAHKGGVFGGLADVQGYSLPRPEATTKKDILEKMEKILFDDEHYMKIHACYQQEFKPHKAENALLLFEEAVNGFD